MGYYLHQTMNKKFVFLLLFSCLFLSAHVVFADTVTLPNPLCLNMANPCQSSPTCICNLTDLIKKITDYISGIIAILATLMFVVSGIMFVASAGNPGKIEQAKKVAIYAAIGAGIALAGKGLVDVIVAVIGASPTP